MIKLNIIHLGIGKVGSHLSNLILKNKNNIRQIYDVDLNYVGMFNSRGGILNPNDLTENQIKKFTQNLSVPFQINTALKKINPPFLLIDTTPSEKTVPHIDMALSSGGFVVMANKKPLTKSQKIFDKLHQTGGKRLFYEATVGAGLPVISTLKQLLESGDEILEITGCFSGTLGFLSSALEEGRSFSESLKEAFKKGYTEPDPRDDLSGMDVARKALILSRVCGFKKELKAVEIKKLYPDYLANCQILDFLEKSDLCDKEFKEIFQKSREKNKTWRYVAQVSKENLRVGLKEIDKSTSLGNLKGTDNILVIKTKHYFDRPLVIQGPGAGIEVTSTGIFGDILQVVRNIRRSSLKPDFNLERGNIL